MNVYDLIVNKKQESNFYTGVISSLSPLQFKIYSSDDAISCTATTGLIGLVVGSNVVLIKIMNKFVVISVIDAAYTPPIIDTNWQRPISIKVKTTSTNRANTTTPTDDPELSGLVLENGFVYEVTAELYVIAGTAGDFKCVWGLGANTSYNLGSGVYALRGGIGVAYTSASVTNSGYMSMPALNMGDYPSTPYSYGGVGGSSWGTYVRDKVFVKCSGGVGSISLQWSQDTSNETNTILRAGSIIKINKISLI